MADTNFRRVLWVLTIENWNPGSTVDVYESEHHSGLPFWGVSCAAHDKSFGILGIICVLTSSVSRLFSKKHWSVIECCSKILDLSPENLLEVFVSLPLESQYHWNPVLGT